MSSGFASEREVGKSCPFCRFPIKTGGEIARCEACNAVHHADCWAENSGCAIVACGSQQLIPAALTAPAPPPAPLAPVSAGPVDRIEFDEPASARPAEAAVSPPGHAAATSVGDEIAGATSGVGWRRSTRASVAAVTAVGLVIIAGAATYLVATAGPDKPKALSPPIAVKVLGSQDVAEVGQESISKATFNKWMGIAAKSQNQQNPGAPVVIPDAPDFVNCVAQKQAVLLVGNIKVASPAQLKRECQAQFDSQKGQVMQLLITSLWIDGQAKYMGVTVSDAEVRKQFEKTKKGAFKTEGQYQKFLKQSGETEDDILFRIKIDALSTKIRDAALKGTDQVSNDAIAKYYASHQQQFGQPETRDIAVVQTKSKAEAAKAKAALSANFSNWAAVAKQYSTDKASVATGGVKRGVVQGQDPNFTKAFSEKLNGQPIIIRTADGNYDLIRVVAVNKGVVQPLDKARASIVKALKQTQQQTTLQNYVKSFQATWKKNTHCAHLYLVDLCGNSPKKAAPAGAGTVQQAPQQQVTP